MLPRFEQKIAEAVQALRNLNFPNVADEQTR